MSALAPTALRQLRQAFIPRGTAKPAPCRDASCEGADYAAVFGPAGIVQQAKEGFIAARFSPSQPLRIKRTSGLRALQPVALPEPSDQFYYILPWEPERLAA